MAEKVSETRIDQNTTMEKEWLAYWNTIKPDFYEPIQEFEMRKAFYAGAATMGFIMQILSENDRVAGGKIVDRLFEEIKEFFELKIKEISTKLKQGFTS